MSHTHTWEITTARIPRETWNLMCAAAQHVFRIAQEEYGIKLVYGRARTSPPVTNESSIRCNGHPGKSGAGDDLVINRTGAGTCSTCGRPYDLAVVAVLNACSLACPDFVWATDATEFELEPGLALGRRAYELARTEERPPAQEQPRGELARAVQTLLQALTASKSGGVGVEQVRAIVAEEVSRLAVPTRVEVSVNGAEPRKIDGAAHKILPDVLAFLGQGINVMLVGPAGSGKTTLAMQAAEALGRKFFMSGAVLQKYELLGYQDANGRYIRSSFRDAFEHGGVFLWDEIDASNPAALVAFNAAMENGHADFPDGQVRRHPDFVAVAAANTYGHGATRDYVGRNALDGATLDRFAVLTMDYDEGLEDALAGNQEWTREVQAYRRAVAKLGIKHIISPRATIRGARMLAAGMARDKVLDALVWKGLAREQRDKIRTEAGYGEQC